MHFFQAEQKQRERQQLLEKQQEEEKQQLAEKQKEQLAKEINGLDFEAQRDLTGLDHSDEQVDGEALARNFQNQQSELNQAATEQLEKDWAKDVGAEGGGRRTPGRRM